MDGRKVVGENIRLVIIAERADQKACLARLLGDVTADPLEEVAVAFGPLASWIQSFRVAAAEDCVLTDCWAAVVGIDAAAICCDAWGGLATGCE